MIFIEWLVGWKEPVVSETSVPVNTGPEYGARDSHNFVRTSAVCDPVRGEHVGADTGKEPGIATAGVVRNYGVEFHLGVLVAGDLFPRRAQNSSCFVL
jgi:hypothetical protein